MAQRLKTLSHRDKRPEQPTWLQCRWEDCKDSWHVDGKSLFQHVYRSHILALATAEDPHASCCPWGGCQLIFTFTSPLRTHVFHHIKPKAYSRPGYGCNLCGDRFASTEERESHDTDVHNFSYGQELPSFGSSVMTTVRKGLLVLVAEDNSVSRDLLRRMLRLEDISGASAMLSVGTVCSF
jgi:hypothetical protein